LFVKCISSIKIIKRSATDIDPDRVHLKLTGQINNSLGDFIGYCMRKIGYYIHGIAISSSMGLLV